MNHIDDDTLLKVALEIHDPDEGLMVQQHLRQCDICRDRYATVTKQISVLRSVSPQVVPIPLPQRRVVKRFTFTWLRAAALILVGVMSGWGVWQVGTPQNIYVAAANLDTRTLPDSLARFAVSDATWFARDSYQTVNSKHN